ncbi:putative inorganic phosphate cotransporter [Manduca sexta]|uniref:putative inorganic phosphate cotransporter n=1 Tax=Manduca sexta TaxID=7130 RepID=UPI00188E2970|nr:putative inorganic phosphate cotransporter [Manduca sexta]
MEKTANNYSKVPTKELLKDPDAEVPPHYGFGVRHIQLIIFTICLSSNFLARGHLGVSIVAMTHAHEIKETHIANLSDVVEGLSENFVLGNVSENINESDIKSIGANYSEIKFDVNDTKEWNVYRTYNWSKPIQEMILGSFFLGYCIMMFPMGMVCQRWGGKLPFQIALFANGIVSFATPWLAMWGGWKAVCCCRIIQGLSQAGTYPSVQMLLANWVSRSERATLSSYLYTGTTIGNIIAFQIGGILAESRWGWPSTFWTVGAASFASFALLTVFGAATPKQHKSITEEEKNFILGRFCDGPVKKPRVPWKALLTSRPIWASFATHVGSGVAYVFFFTQVPSYIHYILGINVKSSGLLSSLPYVASFFTSVGFGITSDYCTNRNLISVKNARRINNSISQVGVAISLILASFATNTVVAIACLVVAMSCHMAIHTGWMVNHIDLAPNFTGTIMSVGNTIMNIFVLLIPVFVSHIVTDVRNPHQWRVMFGIVGALAIACNTVFVIFLSTERQPWSCENYDAVNQKECEEKDEKSGK